MGLHIGQRACFFRVPYTVTRLGRTAARVQIVCFVLHVARRVYLYLTTVANSHVCTRDLAKVAFSLNSVPSWFGVVRFSLSNATTKKHECSITMHGLATHD